MYILYVPICGASIHRNEIPQKVQYLKALKRSFHGIVHASLSRCEPFISLLVFLEIAFSDDSLHAYTNLPNTHAYSPLHFLLSKR